MSETIKLSGVVSGFEAFALQRLMRENKTLIHITSDSVKADFLENILSVVAPDISVLSFPQWDTVPYDRSAPKAELVGERIHTLTQLIQYPDKPFLILTTPAAVMQLLPPPDFIQNNLLDIDEGVSIPFDRLTQFLIGAGYTRSDLVLSVGEFAVRGGLIDIFPAGLKNPIRVDFFGDDIDSIRFFDVVSQRSGSAADKITLKPVREFALTEENIQCFRSKYRTFFGSGADDAVYRTVSEGHYQQGIEHYLPLFFNHLSGLLDYVPAADVSFDYQLNSYIQSVHTQISDYYQARVQGITLKNDLESVYKPVPPESFFLTPDDLKTVLKSRKTIEFSPFVDPDSLDMKSRQGIDFSKERLNQSADIFDEMAHFIKAQSKRVIVSASSDGSAQRLSALMRERGIDLHAAETFKDAFKKAPAIITAPFETGFSTPDFIVLTETDVLGERLVRPVRKKVKTDFIGDISTLNIGDLIVHQTHGIGRFDGLIQLNVDNAAHDCLLLVYADGDKLFVPVENADVLSRYGSGEGVSLDKLGSTSFETRKEKVKKDLFIMAGQLLDTASKRALNKAPVLLPPHGLYQEFCARFPYVETDDQTRSIQDVEQDLASGRPMDRLICGDVGFGKTEVALRAAFLAAAGGVQVALIVPTTLLARQHTAQFTNRFKGFPLRVENLSRLTPPAHRKAIKKGLENGSVDIVIGTHALLSKSIQFNNLGLVTIDEEQHFGVAHKERLKELKAGVHVLTLTATPIPRTLQLSLSGVRDLSIIATPPVDRLAVQTFVTPFDGVLVKEAILREYFRGGQTFFVCPRISDMTELETVLKQLVPEIRLVKAHGQMPAAVLEKIMTDFTDKKYDLLLATSIIESGLDMPSVNTMIVYRADMFGLAALYQLRGRVGRGKLRAWAYLTVPPKMRLNALAEKRLNVMQSLDSLGAGFALASHDLDIRGAGNLLGDAQSGHIREIGVALYQKMLADAVASLRSMQSGQKADTANDYSPQISVGLPVLIPEKYVPDLQMRLSLYRQIGDIKTIPEIESMRSELIDRFGNYPIEVDNLFETITLKILAKKANIERIDAGPKGASIAFYKNTFKNPVGLVAYIEKQLGIMRIRPDQKLVVMRPWPKISDRLKGVRLLIQKIAEIAEAA